MIATLYQDTLQNRITERFLDKTSTCYLIIPELAAIFSDAKLNFLFRNPLAVLHSILETWVHDEWYRSPRHKSNLLLAPRLLLDSQRLVMDNALPVQYENFVANPEMQLQLFCEFLEINIVPEMLQYLQSPLDQPRMGNPTGTNRFDRPNTENLDKWQNLRKTSQTKYLANHYISYFGHDKLAEMGYDINKLASILDVYKTPKPSFFIQWEYFFLEKQTFGKVLRLILLGFIKTLKPSLLLRQIKQLHSETFIHHTAWYG